MEQLTYLFFIINILIKKIIILLITIKNMNLFYLLVIWYRL